jgi:WD40 repeat protein
MTCIGRGSYGEVWLARNAMGTYRAVKIVYRASFEHARPFEREFNGIKKFEPLSRSHDGFVDILQVGKAEGYFYYVMELADDAATGQEIDPAHYEPKTLRSALKEKGRLPFEECVQLGIQLTQALAHLHKHGLIHRDIKPSNLIFVYGQPKLADIGLVAEQSEAKSFVGTEGFIPPEGPGTPQADIYSLGKVLYEMATGKDRHEFPELPTLIGETSDEMGLLEFNSVFLKACQTDIARRYQRAEQMREDLLLLQGGKSVKRAQAVQRRLNLLTRISIAGSALILLVLSGLYFFRQQARQQAQLRARAEARELEARQNLYAADMVLAGQAREADDIGYTRELLERWVPRSGDKDFRGWEWRYLARQVRGDELYTLGTHSNGVTTLALFPDGRRLASASKDTTVKIWDLDTRREIMTLVHAERVNAMAISPDGNTLISGSDDGVLRTWNAASGQVVDAVTNRYEASRLHEYNRLLFSPSGKLLVVAAKSGIRLLEWPSRREIIHWPGSGTEFKRGIAFSPDGRTLAFGTPSGNIVLWDVADSVQTRVFAHPPSAPAAFLGPGILDLGFSPDGRTLAAAGYNGLAVLDLETGDVKAAYGGFKHAAISASFSPDQQTLAVTTADQKVRLFETSTWRELVTLRGHTFEVWSGIFTPDGSRLITAGKEGHIKVWDATARRSQPDSLILPSENTLSALAEDGSEIIAINADRRLSRWKTSPLGEGLHSFVPPTSWPIVHSALPHVLMLAEQHSNSVEIKDLFTHRGLLRLTNGFGPRLVARSGDGEWMAFANPQFQIEVWKLTTTNGVAVLDQQPNQVVALALSPRGERLAVGYWNGTVELWDLGRTKCTSFKTWHKDPVCSLTFSPSGKVLATTSYDTHLKLLNVESGKEIAKLGGQLIFFSAVAFSPDETRMAGGGGDGSVTIWDLNTDPPLTVAKLKGHSKAVHAIAFQPDGNTLVSLSADQARFWRADPKSATPGPNASMRPQSLKRQVSATGKE